ncbi:hypothetical protein [Methanoculleus sp. UBA303]|jgi:hypothetical protein|uniref:hypothetical protein n=1 Tax=Methanoculleus sp. UBA303 TaxID=1915497 RepID=UPI0025D86B08|nr:hypothetical protein [Methanoculleus sp. UBA303]MDD3932327.1 hypothetical protein [Methanoculleus sp.]
MLVQAAVSDARYLRRCSKNLYATGQWFFENGTFLKYQNYRLCKTNENHTILQAATTR